MGRSESAIRMQRIAAIIAFLLMRIAITLNPRTALPRRGAGDQPSITGAWPSSIS